jgi:hypothetical protein
MSLLNIPKNLLTLIGLYSGNHEFFKMIMISRYIHTFDKHEYVKMYNKVLIYGDIQCGKTKQIIQEINNPLYEKLMKIIVVINSIDCLNQYKTRLTNEKLHFQIINKKTKEITKPIVVIMNNYYRMSYFKKLNDENKFILFIDESDLCIQNMNIMELIKSPLNYRTIHITSTPFHNYYHKNDKNIQKPMSYFHSFDNIIHVPKHEHYYGVQNMNMYVNDELDKIIQNHFLKEPFGILLYTRDCKITNMLKTYKHLYNSYPQLTIVYLSHHKNIFMDGKLKDVSHLSISKIIDMISTTHSILIANRLATRCISYVSSDYQKHLTYQVMKIKYKTQFFQQLRLCGIYKDNPQLNLFITSKCIRKYKYYLELNKKMTEYFIK